uniref:Bardet-Biedl syndrome 4 protein n=2 Tax=Mantoniella antarctica TaxID=81844 RepID=A0A7S0X8Q1_9CHLO|mmetsp:Transcript_26328/g.65955  ORF Transcript_26328/g.65955 Transcript_26328/m.65955 type:complete len:446 (+) Transcript_26328:120-1457(+)
MDHGTGAGDSDPEVEDDQVDIEPPSTVATPLMKPGASSSASSLKAIARERRNYQIHLLYVRQDFKDCLVLIETVLAEFNGMCEYPIYVKALIKRQQGQIQESLQLFQAATALNPHNVANLKQVGRSLYLLGKHKAAIDVYDEAQRIGVEDWEIWHNKGLCYMYLKDYDQSVDCFRQANEVQRHDTTFTQMGKVFTLQENYKQAIEVYLEALEFSPENPEVLTTIGLLYLRLGENYRAFDFLGNSLTHDPKNPKTILAAGSIIQDHSDMDVALIKYRIAAVQTPNSAQLWNNIGMCFFGKQRYIASIACLKRALYLDPFEWIISYNLGLVHLNTGQCASAFHFFSSSINLKSDFPSSYMYLAITLAKLDDLDNACAAYEKAIGMESDHLFHLNYAVTLLNSGDETRAAQQLEEFEKLFGALDDETKGSDPDILLQRNLLTRALAKP